MFLTIQTETAPVTINTDHILDISPISEDTWRVRLAGSLEIAYEITKKQYEQLLPILSGLSTRNDRLQAYTNMDAAGWTDTKYPAKLVTGEQE